jgi:acetylornithine deacetylase
LPLEGRPNLVVTVGGKRKSGRSLLLNSHIDTVPWRDEQHKWSVHPLSGDVHDGRVYGRGVVDAKGQVLAALMAVLALRDIGYEPGGWLIVESVVDEEPGGSGTLSMCAQGYAADAAIILEPTDCHVACGHRGVIGLRYTVEGTSGHGSVRSSGPNAIMAVSRLAPLINDALTGWMHEKDADYGPPSVNVGRIEGGDSIFSVPAACRIEIGVRYAPGTYHQVIRHISERLGIGATRSGSLPGAHTEGEVFCHYDAAEVDAGSTLVDCLSKCTRHSELAAEPVVFPACCDARHFINRYGIPAVIFGAGSLDACHAVDECLPIWQWSKAIETLALFVTRWCR